MTPPRHQRRGQRPQPPAGGGMGSGVTVLFLVLLVGAAVLAVVLV
jgi:hypothetical protein